MTPMELENAAKKILKLVQVNGTAIRCTYKSMSTQEWLKWKKDTVNVESWFNYTITQDYESLQKMCETWLLRLEL